MENMGQIYRRFGAIAMLALFLFGSLSGCQKRTTVNLAELETLQASEETQKTEAAPEPEMTAAETTEAPAVTQTAETTVPESGSTVPAPEETAASEAESTDAAEEAPETQAVEAEPAAVQEETSDYILNTNSGKIHRPNCKSVQKMKESNKKKYTGTLEELEAQGYVPCKICKP